MHGSELQASVADFEAAHVCMTKHVFLKCHGEAFTSQLCASYRYNNQEPVAIMVEELLCKKASCGGKVLNDGRSKFQLCT